MKKKKTTTQHPAAATDTREKRTRLPRKIRRAQIMDAAARLIVQQGFLPLSTRELARQAGISKGLVYAYFPTQYELFNALLERELTELRMAGLETASRVDDLEQAALLCTMLYFDHVTRAGSLLHILLTDRYMAGSIDGALLCSRNRILVRLTRLARRSLPLSRKEIVAAIEMLAAIPEEAGSLAFHEELEPSTARRICHALLLTSLEALRSPDDVLLTGSDDVSRTAQNR